MQHRFTDRYIFERLINPNINSARKQIVSVNSVITDSLLKHLDVDM